MTSVIVALFDRLDDVDTLFALEYVDFVACVSKHDNQK